MARKPPVLLALLALLLVVASPAQASTFRIAFASPGPEVTEGQEVGVTISRDGASDRDASVAVDGFPGGKTGAILFRRGETSRAVSFRPPQDDVVEAAQELTLRLTDPSPGDDVAPETTRLVVHDDDAEFAQPDISVSEAAGEVLLPMRRLDAAVPAPVRLGFVFGSATYKDFGTYPSRVELPAGDLAPTIPVKIAQDRDVEQPERFTVTLKAPFGVERPDIHPPITVTIVDSDRLAPTASIVLPAHRRLVPVVPLTLTCDEACSATVELRADPALLARLSGRRRLAAAQVHLAAATPASVHLHIDPALIRRLRGLRRARVTLRVTVADAAGNRRTVTRRFSLMR